MWFQWWLRLWCSLHYLNILCRRDNSLRFPWSLSRSIRLRHSVRLRLRSRLLLRVCSSLMFRIVSSRMDMCRLIDVWIGLRLEWGRRLFRRGRRWGEVWRTFWCEVVLLEAVLAGVDFVRLGINTWRGIRSVLMPVSHDMLVLTAGFHRAMITVNACRRWK